MIGWRVWLLLTALRLPAVDARAVLRYEGGRVEGPIPLAAIFDPTYKGFDSAWVWSAGSPPQRHLAKDLPAVRLQATRARLAVALDRRRDEAVQRVRLVAAPVAMWGQVPEPLLPSWELAADDRARIPIDPGVPWRLRLIGTELGSWWVDVPPGQRSVRVRALPAESRQIRIVGDDRSALPDAGLTVMSSPAGSAVQEVLAQFRSSKAGEITLEALPDAADLGLVVAENEHAPSAWGGRPPSLPREIRLERGVAVRGRVVDTRRRPVAGARIHGEAWIAEGAKAIAQRRTTSDPDGRWSLASLPARAIGLVISAEGLATVRTTLRADRGESDLGEVVLSPEHALRVLAVDDLGTPIAGAEVRAGGARAVATDTSGRAVARGGESGERLQLRASAARHQPASVWLEPPLPPESRIRLTRSLHLSGRILDPAGAPVLDGEVRITTGDSYRTEPLLAGGTFGLDVAPGPPVELLFQSPQARELKLILAPGRPGEHRDLGDLRSPAGLSARGRLLRIEDGQPVAAARIWAPRGAETGEVVAWAEGNLVQTASDAEGRFTLAGLVPGPFLLRIDGPGRARAHVRGQPEPEVAEVDLGDLALSPGATVLVRVSEEESAGALARVDLRGQWLELDMLTAPFAGGEAAVRNVPPGEALVTVLADREVLCEESIEIGESEREVEVDCGRPERTVNGVVLVAGRPAGPGIVQWHREGGPESAAIIFNDRRPSGITQQQTFGAGRPSVEVAVTSEGQFTTRRLSPGTWSVRWTPVAGPGSRPRQVELAEADGQTLTLSFGAHLITGVVLDGEDGPVEGARIRDARSDAFALSAADGTFAMSDLELGEHQIYARLRDRTSDPVAVELVPERAPDPVVLRLDEESEAEIRVAAVGAAGPAAGALVFLDMGTEMRIATSDLAGHLRVPLSYPLPSRVRAAGFFGGVWALGQWTELDRNGGELVIAFSAAGSLTLSSEQGQGLVQIRGPGEWDITQLLLRLGAAPTIAPDAPLRVTGLMPGSYTVALGQVTASATVSRDHETELDLR